MSASEKLKALHERPEWIKTARYTYLQSAPWTPIQENLNEACLAYDELYQLLPQIVAVVEAAEQHEHSTQMEIALQIGEATCDIDAALAALEEALS